jgi:outer membrane receptor protein involved in Fe transport
MSKFRYTASMAVLAACIAGTAAAQENEAVVSEIVVTAQKREQNLQDVPIVVTAISGQQLQDAGVRDIKDLQTLTPGLSVTSSTSEAQTSARIRGVGTIGDNPGLESSVGTVIDGVYRARSSVAFGDLGELERVEVLKGPQGTLFGKNTSAGVISVITKAPTFDFSAEGEVTVGNYEARGVSATINGPIVDNVLAGRLYAARRVRDGVMDVGVGAGPRTDTQDNNQDYYTVRGQVLWLASDSVEVKFMGDYTDRDESCCSNTATFVGATGAIVDALAADGGVVRPADPFSRFGYANRDMISKVTDQGFSAQVDWDINPDMSLTSITAWRGWKAVTGGDIDYSSADLWYRDGRTYAEIEAFSQEVRLAGATDNLDWLVGAFYADEDLETAAATALGTSYETYFSLLLSGGANPAAVSALTGLPVGTNFPAGAGTRDSYQHNSKGWALFTNNSWRPTEAIEITLGLRYTDEEKSVASQYRNAAPAAACAAALVRPIPAAARAAICAPHTDPAFNSADTRQKRDEKRWSGTIKGAYRFGDNLMTYLSYAEGFKAGGFNLDRNRFSAGVINPDTSFPAETVKSWELGAKTNTDGYGLILNAAIFHQTFEDFQLNTYTGVSFVVQSIPEVVSRGVDADVMWRTPVDGLNVTGGVTYAETQYGDFVSPGAIFARLPNTRLSYAPLWSGVAAVNYERDLSEGLRLRASLSAKYTSEYNTGSNLDPLKSQEAFTLLNGRVALDSADDRWSVELWGQNLTDQEFYQVIVDQPLQSGTYAGFLGNPRFWGVTLRARY